MSTAQSISKLDSIKSLYNETTNDSLKITLEIELSRALHKNQHDEEQEYAYAESAVERALQYKDTLLYARALDNHGLLYRFHQHYEEGLGLHIKAFDLIKNKNVKPYYKMRFSNNAGVAARYLQKYAMSVLYFMKALKIADKENDLRNISISCNGIGNALINISGREDEALLYFERALETEKTRDNSLGMAINYLSISDYYISKEKYNTARNYLDKLVVLNKKSGNDFGLALTYQSMGLAYLKECKDLGKSKSYFNNALGRFKILNDRHRQSDILLNLANIELKLNNTKQAEGYFLESLALAKELGQNDLASANSMSLSQIFENRNNYKKSLYYYKQSKAFEDSIKITDQNIKIEALTRQYNLEKKENQIQLLEKDKALRITAMENQKQLSERRKVTLLLLIVAFVMLLIVFLLQYRNYRTKKKTTAQIQKTEKEIMNAIYERNLAQAEILVTRLQVNPHFLFNSLNAIMYLIQSKQNLSAIKYLKIFSRYTRMVLETSTQHVISLQEELKLSSYYLMLEENRFEEGFMYEIKGDDCLEVQDAVIPPLLLQPFIENAIWHGLLPSTSDNKLLLIEIVPDSENLQIIIEDNGVGRNNNVKKSVKKPHKSMGMQIIQERVELYNQSSSDKINIEIVDKTDKDGQPAGTKVIINLLRDKH
ncbi:histidine kinase [Winogradskyella sp. SM1960]|uniref:histidine kinase n=1 Tax=Winogradskyella sp. SM1960 TaxID=2865955 RepID=UPI001CD1F54D|nr:histidine kinase [Winogradskyella sp. SM1960]